jgi:hypothetical protein
MKAKLVLMGKQIDMAPRAHRRTLVVLIYSMMAILLAGLWFVDRWRTSGIYLILATMLVNRWFLGGYHFGGLIKPFSSKGPLHRNPVFPPPPFLKLTLQEYSPEPYHNDERELHQRDRAHYQAYQIITNSLVCFYMLAGWWGIFLQFLTRRPLLANELLCGLALVAMVSALTLPQAILLWREPDIEEYQLT